MEGKGIRWSGVLRERGVPCDVLRLGNQAERCSRKGRHVQRLANMASCLFRTAGVVMESRAGGEVQQRQAAQYGQRASRSLVPEDSP